MDFTFWQVLGLLNKRNAIQAIDLRGESYSVGYYGWLAVVALTGPFLNRVWKDKRALLGGLAPFIIHTNYLDVSEKHDAECFRRKLRRYLR